MSFPIPLAQIKQKLLQDNLLTAERFVGLTDEAQRKNQDLLQLLISEHIADARYFSNFIASFLGVEAVNFSAYELKPEAVRLISEDIARQRNVIAFNQEPDGTVDVAMADPSDLATIEFLTEHLKLKIKPFLATLDDLNRGYSIYGSELTGDFKHLIEKNIEASLRTQNKSVEQAAADLPIVAVADNVLSYAMSLHASDIHLEVLEEATLIRYRIDGILYEILRVPKAIHSALVARVKILSGLKLDEHYRPQDGRFRYQIASQLVDIRVSVLPTFYGEKIVMRLLEASQKPLSLEELGMLTPMADRVRGDLKKSYGMILSCGPTGSGKTTSLYGIMNILNKPNVNIVTIEDPIEYNMRYVNQAQVNVQAGITFASGLRSILRQDPNIVMVGEIRDEETAGIAVQAALTGHLMLSSLHTNDAPTAIPRLFDLKIPPFLVASTMNIIIAQRLVRKICTTCIYSYQADNEEVKLIKETLVSTKVPKELQRVPSIFFRGKGCISCGNSGYRSRLGIFEVLDMSDKIKEVIIASDFTLEALFRAARETGMESMFEDGLKKVELGLTTVQEVMRVIKE
ncbi:MAG: GspE/PulE family protein [bacterium]|nr:GspE/PulE family protein [bacterium]